MRPSQLLAAAFALASVTAAWPDVFDSGNALGEVKNVLYGRQDDNSESESARPQSTAASEEPKSTGDAEETDQPTATDSDNEPKETGEASGTAKESDADETGTGKASRTRSIPADSPAGGIDMMTPAAIAGTQLYKVGDNVTFAWNYTSLVVTPSAIDILASCSANEATYTLAVNESVKETGKIVWDTQKYEESNQIPLLTEMYTLIIYDAELSVSATAKPGHLGVANRFQFAMYTPQPYEDLDPDYKCATCSGALSHYEALTLKALVITSSTTIASLLYFTYSFGLW